MSELSALTLTLLGVVSIPVLFLSIAAVRRDHPHHIHTLWYVFSLTFCSVSVLFFYIYENATSIETTALGGLPGKAAMLFMNASMDVREELYILAALCVLCILPQVLSYLISGAFGCGSPPAFIGAISRVLIWSLIKFLCVLSGILAAQSVFGLYGRPYLYPKDGLIKGIESLFIAGLSFWTMAIYYKIEVLYAVIVRKSHMAWVESFASFMTRYRKKNA